MIHARRTRLERPLRAGANLGGIGEIAEMLGVGRAAVVNWVERYGDFPAPLIVLGMGPVFDLDEVQAWYNDWKGV